MYDDKNNYKKPYEAPDFFDICPITIAIGGEGDSEDDDVIHDPDFGDGDF